MDDEQQPRLTAMRRKPQRARGQQRVSTILDAAEQLFGEAGYEATTTNAIAARAGIPIGSVYQFFPNKEAILHAVAGRYRREFAAFFDPQLTPEVLELPIGELTRRLIAAMVEFGGAHLGYTRIVLQGHSQPQLAAVAAELQHDLVERMDGLLRARVPRLSAQERQLYATVGLTAVLALLALAINSKLAGDYDQAMRLIDQAGVLLVSYIEYVTA